MSVFSTATHGLDQDVVLHPVVVENRFNTVYVTYLHLENGFGQEQHAGSRFIIHEGHLHTTEQQVPPSARDKR